MRSFDRNICISAAQQSIGEKLRAIYSPLVDEPVPERFADLLRRLDAEMPQSPKPSRNR